MCEAWQRSLIEEDELVKKAAATVPRLLDHPGITLEQVSRLHGNIDTCVERMDCLIVALQVDGIDRSWLKMATSIRDSWTRLAERAATRVIDFQSLPADPALGEPILKVRASSR